MGLKPELTSKSFLGLDYETFMQGARKVLPTYVPKVPETPYKNDPYTAQIRQLQDANQFRDPTNGRWNVRNQTGFDDERDNQIDDRALRQQSYANYQEKNGDSDMSDYKNSGKTVINSSRPSDYAPGERANLDRAKIQLDAMNQRYGIDATTGANLQNYQWQSQDRQFATRLNAGVDSQVRNRKIEYDSADNQFRTLADYLAAIDRNRVTGEVGFDANKKQLEGSKFKTTTEDSTDRWKWTTQGVNEKYEVDAASRTEIAKEQVKKGTYGIDPDTLSKERNDQINFDYWKSYNDQVYVMSKRQDERQAYARQVAVSERSYNDQRSDLEKARRAAESRFNIERNDRIANLEYDRQQRKIDRDRSYYEFDVRRNDANATLAQQNAFRQQELAFRQQEINNSSALDQARIAQIYADTKLKNDQFGAGRADISYNRNIQRSRSIAF